MIKRYLGLATLAEAAPDADLTKLLSWEQAHRTHVAIGVTDLTRLYELPPYKQKNAPPPEPRSRTLGHFTHPVLAIDFGPNSTCRLLAKIAELTGLSSEEILALCHKTPSQATLTELDIIKENVRNKVSAALAKGEIKPLADGTFNGTITIGQAETISAPKARASFYDQEIRVGFDYDGTNCSFNDRPVIEPVLEAVRCSLTTETRRLNVPYVAPAAVAG